MSEIQDAVAGELNRRHDKAQDAARSWRVTFVSSLGKKEEVVVRADSQADALLRAKQAISSTDSTGHWRVDRVVEDESFEKLEHSLAHKKGVHDPKALAAYIGREHGKI